MVLVLGTSRSEPTPSLYPSAEGATPSKSAQSAHVRLEDVAPSYTCTSRVFRLASSIKYNRYASLFRLARLILFYVLMIHWYVGLPQRLPYGLEA